jgi:hypothetical protein
LNDLGQDPIIVKFDDRDSYYEAIQDFRDYCFTNKDFYLGELL